MINFPIVQCVLCQLRHQALVPNPFPVSMCLVLYLNASRVSMNRSWSLRTLYLLDKPALLGLLVRLLL
jgi:hypothetical protein